MAEKNEEVNSGEQEGAQQEQQNQQRQPAVNDKVARQLAALTGLTDTDALKKQLGRTDSNEGDDQNEEPEGEEQEGGEQEEEVEGKENGADAVEKKGEKKPTEKEEPAPVKKNKLGINLPGTKKVTDVVIENPEQILDIVKSKFGMDIKEVKDLPKFFEQTTQWRTDAQKLKSVQSDLEELQGSIKSLPLEFVEAIDLFASGQDYTAPFTQKSKFNFSIPVEKQNVKDLVNNYFPGKFTDEDFNEKTPGTALDIAMTASKDKFIAEKKSYDGKRAAVSENAQRTLQVLQSSVASSVSQLKQDFPEADVDTLKEVEAIFEGGPQGVLNLFFNKDGSANINAAKMVFMAKNGEDVIHSMMEQAKHQAESRINEDILTRGADTKKPVQRNSGANNTMTEEMKQRLAKIPSTPKTRTY